MPYAAALFIFWIQYLLCAARVESGQTPECPVGGMFDREEHRDVYEAFQYAITEHNMDRLEPYSLTVENRTTFINMSNSFDFSHSLCDILKKGVFAVFGTADIKTISTLVSYSNKLHMPFFSTTIADRSESSKYHIRMHPDYSKAMLELIKKYRWNVFYYIYDSEEGLKRMKYIIERVQDDKLKKQIEPLRIKDPSNAYALLRHLDTRGQSEEGKISDINIVVDMSTQRATNLLFKQIRKVGMNRPNYHYIIGGLGMDELDLDDFKHSGVNITGFSIVNHTAAELQPFYKSWRRWKSSRSKERISHQAALMRDSVKVFTDTMKRKSIFSRVFRKRIFYNNRFPGIICFPETKKFYPWVKGEEIIEQVTKVDIEGLTGKIKFDKDGRRTDFVLNIMEVSLNSGPKLIGTWNERMESLHVTQTRNGGFKKTSKHNETKIITTILSSPYLMYRKNTDNGEPFHGNDRFEGYCADLAKAVAEIVQFKYVLEPVPDGTFGTLLDNGEWNGMIKQLTSNKAQLAIAPLTISSQRERVVDFSKPFMSLGISIMIKKPEKQKPGVFSFMDPLSKSIWMCIILAYIGVSVVLFLVSRFSPYEWQVEDSINGPVFTNDFTILNSLWFALGAFMQQGCDISPRSISGRTVGSVWWFFTLIIISSYTANLAAFLTVERMLTPIESVDDLAKQTEIQYGTLRSGSTMDFFKDSKIPVYEGMWKFMDMHKEQVFVSTTEEGVDKVRNSKGKYAFLLESTMNEYYNQRKPCNTMKVGNNLDSKGYGIATPLESPIRDQISLAVLQLRESGELRRLHKKWWYDKGECSSEGSQDSTQSALTLSNVAGIFYILIGGLGLSMIISLLEFLYKSKHAARKQKTTFGAAMRSKARLSIHGQSERENGGVGMPDIDIDVPKSVYSMPIARSTSVSLV